jgi:Ca2+-binding RTX toxin-like protein
MAINRIDGTDANDHLLGTDAPDLIHAREGDDFVVTSGARDSVYGQDGNDSVFGYSGDEVLHGGEGDDQLVTSSFENDAVGLLYGGLGNDRLFAGSRADQAYGGQGDDEVTVYVRGSGQAHGGGGIDRLNVILTSPEFGQPDLRIVLVLDGSGAGAQIGFGDFLAIDGFERLRVTAFGADDYVLAGNLDDQLELGAGANTALALGGDDTVSFVTGAANFLDGGAGEDTLHIVQNGFSGALTLTVSGTTGEDQDGSRLTNFESWLVHGGDGDDRVVLGDGRDGFWGYKGADSVRGGAGVDRLSGEQHADTLAGGAGRDRIEGGPGHDLLTGGAGGDAFVYLALDPGADRITDFATGEDRLLFGRFALGGVLERGALDASRFSLDAAAGTGAQFVLADGALFWDTNGSDDGGAHLIARLTGQPPVQAEDILIV